MKKTVYLLLFASAFLLILTQCRNKQEKQLYGIWKLDVMEVNGTEISGSSLGEWMWEFNEEGGYLVMVAGAKEKGKYSLKDGKLTMKSVTVKEKPETVYEVTRLDSAAMNLTAEGEKNTSHLHFIKIHK
jgi:hypothetical protein